MAVTSSALADDVTVARVTSGDSIETEDGRTIYLTGADAPELNQPMGGDAWLYTTRLIKGQAITLEEFDESTNHAIVIIDGRDLGKSLLRHGLAWLDEDEVSGYVATVYRQAYERAKRDKRGLWATHIPPWEFRGSVSQPDRASMRSVGLAGPDFRSPPKIPANSASKVRSPPKAPIRRITVSAPRAVVDRVVFFGTGFHATDNPNARTSCPPCRATRPHFDALAATYPNVQFRATYQRAEAFRAGVQQYPTVIGYSGNREVFRHIGLADSTTLNRHIRGQ